MHVCADAICAVIDFGQLLLLKMHLSKIYDGLVPIAWSTVVALPSQSGKEEASGNRCPPSD